MIPASFPPVQPAGVVMTAAGKGEPGQSDAGDQDQKAIAKMHAVARVQREQLIDQASCRTGLIGALTVVDDH